MTDSIWLNRLDIRRVSKTEDRVTIEIVSKITKVCVYIIYVSDIYCQQSRWPKYEYYPVNTGKVFPLTPSEEQQLKADMLSLIYHTIYNNKLI